MKRGETSQKLFMKILRALLFTLLTAFVMYALNNKFSEIPFLKDHIPESLASAPPLGKFIDPFKGFWTNATSKNISKQQDLNIKGLKSKVEVLFDDRLVPHIFAQNDEDLYFAQGYVTAQNRLWQMEFQTHAAAGRLSEIVGDKALDYDLFQRKVGMGFAAENALKGMLANENSKRALESYTEGVNAYIENLKPQDYPIEYKLLDYAPEPWTNIKVAYMLKIMAFDLSASGNDDQPLSELLAKYDKATVSELFPSYFERTTPVIPAGTKLDFKPLKVPKTPADLDSTLLQIAKNIVTTKNIDKNNSKEKSEKPEKGAKGSNNWAVSAKKSATGFPMLANDPHLKLSLPSIWYEVQLVSPTTNVYGVSLPGTPCVIIGFNQNISWGITNTYADVLDIYQLKTKDNKFEEYFFEGEWKKTTQRNEIIKIRGSKEITQIVHYTHHGPIVFEKEGKNFGLDIPVAHALRWTAYDTSNELLALYKVNKASQYEEFVEGLSTFKCPASNFAYADKDKNIAMNVTGAMPLRWKEQGKYVLDGSKASHDWAAMLEQAHYPHVLNPERGFVSSANQFSTDTTSYPYYLNWDYISPERAIRINEQLTASGKISVEDMRKLQNDYLNILARDILPRMLAKTNFNNGKSTENSYQAAYQILSKWNLQNSPESVGATIFEVWWSNFNNALWADDMGNIRFPATDKTVLLIVKDTNSRWYDDVRTPEKENMSIILTNSFKKTVNELQKQHGEISDTWSWGKHRGTDIGHIARIGGFGKKNLQTGGGGRIVNATTKTNGPSWRMVVQLGENPKGFGIYPGGQSGNPGSYFYDDMLEKWRLGELSELLFIKKADFNSPRILGRMKMN